jgi:hypothetical protein
MSARRRTTESPRPGPVAMAWRDIVTTDIRKVAAEMAGGTGVGFFDALGQLRSEQVARFKQILRDADWSALESIRREISGMVPPPDHKQQWLDIVREAMEAVNAREWQSAGEAEQQKREALIRRIRTEAGEFPDLPCTLEVALRWSITAPERLPFERIERVFLIFLASIEEERESGLRKARALPGEIIPEPTSEFTSGNATALHRKYWGEKKSLVGLSAAADDVWRKYWLKGGLEVRHIEETDLLFLATDFRRFWVSGGHESRWKAEHEAKRDAAMKTNQNKRSRRNWTDADVLELVKAYTERTSPENRTPESARAFTMPGREQADCGEILGAFMAYRDSPGKAAVEGIVDVLSRAAWRLVSDAAGGSSAGTAARKKSGRKRAAHAGIDISPECVRQCRDLLLK